MSKRLNEPKGLYPMKFIGKPDGKLMKNAPGNYIHGKEYNQPYHMSQFPYWELMTDTPTLVAPPLDAEDNVFEETVFISGDLEEAVIEINPSPEKIIGNVNVDPDAPASIKPYMHYSPASNKLSEYVEPVITTTEPIGDFTLSSTGDSVEPTRDELKKRLDDAGVEYDKRARTSTLKKLVEELEPQE